MNKTILLANLILSGLVTAQQNSKNIDKIINYHQENLEVQKDFFEQKLFNDNRINTLSTKNKPQSPITEREAKISEAKKKFRDFYLKNRHKVAYFIAGQPVFLKSNDTDQNKTSNVDAIQNGGVTGLEGNFLGEGIHITVFDGGKAQETHEVFQENSVSRVNNKETDTNVFYDAHATAVTSMIGGKDNPISFTQNGKQITGNTRGVLPKATFDNYAYHSSLIEGRNRNIMGKIIDSTPALSNHSYGLTVGWSDGGIAGKMYYGFYDKETQQSFDQFGFYGLYDFYYDYIIHSYPNMIMVKAAGNAFGDTSSSSLNFFYDTQLNTDNEDDKTGAMFEFDMETFEFKAFTPPPANCAKGYDCIESGSVGKNAIIVGATEKIPENLYTQIDNVAKASYSNAGPRDDGAIKPDIASVGSDIISASYNRRIANHYEQGSGTSYSTPHITGIIGLWQEINRTLFDGADFGGASAKNLLIHTAKEAGNIGPDVWYGWGLANAKAGAELLVNKANNNVIFEEKSLENKDKHEFFLESDGKQPLKVSITWIDPPYYRPYNDLTWKEIHNYKTSTLVNDLDLRIINTETKEVFYPWKLDADNPMSPALKGDNIVDNVEQVLIETPKKGTYKVEISHKGTLTKFNLNSESKPEYTPASQEYSIIATGFSKSVSSQQYYNETNASNIVYPSLLSNTESLVKVDNINKDIDSVSIYNSAGRLLSTEKVVNQPYTLDFTNLPSGVYIINIHLKSSKETITRKVLKR